MSAAGKASNTRWALITGAAKRVGAEVSRHLHAHGIDIAVHYRSSSNAAEALCDELNAKRDASALSLQADLLEISGIPGLVDRLIEQTGRLDILINNASSFYPTPMGSITEQHWHELVGSNLKAPLFLCQAAAPHLRRSGGVIINMADIHARRPMREHIVYGIAKAGMEMLTRSLARELGPEIRVNGVAPGAVLWPDSGLSDGVQDSIIRQIALKRPGSPDDIARCIRFLIDDAPYITGETITVDGGRSVGW